MEADAREEARADLRGWIHGAALLAVLVLAGLAAFGQSFTTDEPYHLAAGRQALAHGRNNLNLEHPPLVKMIAAWPWVATGEAGPSVEMPGATLRSQEELFADAEIAHRVHRRSRFLPWLPRIAPQPSPTLGRRLLATGLLAGLAIAPAWGSYAFANRHYQPEEGRRAIRVYSQAQGSLRVGERMKPWEPRLLALEERHPLLAQWATGFVGINVQNAIGTYPSYVLGKMDSGGRVWYYPFVLLIKTPLVILVAAFATAFIAWRRRRDVPERVRAVLADGSWSPWVAPGLTLLIYLGLAMSSTYNIGSRHLLPVLPLLYLPAAWWLSRRRARLAVGLALLAIESFALAPVWVPATNTWFLGEANPTRFALCCADGEYHQGLIALGREARRRDLEPLGVMRPGTLPDQLHMYLPDARVIEAGSPISPGWYAVSVLVEEGVPAIEAAKPGDLYQLELYRPLAATWGATWDEIRGGEDHGWIAGSFHLYRVPEH